MKKGTLVLVESPLQLLCAYEVLARDETSTLYLRKSGRGRNDEHLLMIASLLDIEYKTFRLYVDTVPLDLIRNIPLWVHLLINKYQEVYAGSFFSRGLKFVARLATRKAITYLDDGVGTFLAQKEMISSGKSSPVFTFFDIEEAPDQHVRRHQFENLRSKFNCHGTKEAYFIGQPLVEYGYVSREEYLLCVEFAVKSSKNRRLIYIPHRMEGDVFRHDLERIIGLEVKDINVCIELYFLRRSCGPDQLFGCSSSALFSLAGMFPDSRITAFALRSERYNAIPHMSEIQNALLSMKNICVTPVALGD